MKKTLSLLAVLGIAVIVGTQSASAFCWSNLNPAYWGHCPKCEKKKADCGCKKKIDKDCPCTTGAAAPCDPCAKKVKKVAPCEPCSTPPMQTRNCEPCDRLQQEMAK